MFHFPAKFHFTLRGASGNGIWKVTITDDEGTTSTTLSTTEEDFHTSSKSITIECQNDGSGAEIFFESSKDTVVRLPSEWDGWKCDNSAEQNERCKTVRQGKLFWDATYEITFPGIPMYQNIWKMYPAKFLATLISSEIFAFY